MEERVKKDTIAEVVLSLSHLPWKSTMTEFAPQEKLDEWKKILKEAGEENPMQLCVHLFFIASTHGWKVRINGQNKDDMQCIGKK